MAEPSEREEEPHGTAEDQGRWYACYTRGRHEKRVKHMLEGQGFETYLPLVPRLSRWRDRTRSVEWPLFPSYVFGRFSLTDVYTVLTTPGVSTIVKADGVFAAIPDAELENVRLFTRLLRNGPVVPEPVPYFGEGQWVEVVDGPFTGLRGIVEHRQRRRRVLVGIRAIGQGLELDVDVSRLRPIDPPQASGGETGRFS